MKSSPETNSKLKTIWKFIAQVIFLLFTSVIAGFISIHIYDIYFEIFVVYSSGSDLYDFYQEFFFSLFFIPIANTIIFQIITHFSPETSFKNQLIRVLIMTSPTLVVSPFMLDSPEFWIVVIAYNLIISFTIDQLRISNKLNVPNKLRGIIKFILWTISLFILLYIIGITFVRIQIETGHYYNGMFMLFSLPTISTTTFHLITHFFKKLSFEKHLVKILIIVSPILLLQLLSRVELYQLILVIIYILILSFIIDQSIILIEKRAITKKN